VIIFGVVQNNQKIYARIMRQSTKAIKALKRYGIIYVTGKGRHPKFYDPETKHPGFIPSNPMAQRLLFGIPIYLKGFNITIPVSHLLVGNPCSGLRSLMAFLALGVIFAYLQPVSIIKKWILFLASFNEA